MGVGISIRYNARSLTKESMASAAQVQALIDRESKLTKQLDRDNEPELKMDADGLARRLSELGFTRRQTS